MFALITGYSEPPAGLPTKEGLHYNKYFPGGYIAMAKNVYNGVVDYDDGTPNNASQLAKDVTTFLAWSSVPENDERKLLCLRALVIASISFGFVLYTKRHIWSYLKSKKFIYKSQK